MLPVDGYDHKVTMHIIIIIGIIVTIIMTNDNDCNDKKGKSDKREIG